MVFLRSESIHLLAKSEEFGTDQHLASPENDTPQNHLLKKTKQKLIKFPNNIQSIPKTLQTTQKTSKSFSGLSLG